MKNIIKVVYTAIAMACFSTASFADAGNFNGFYVGVTGSSIGAELDGSYTSNEGVVSKGTGGKIATVGAIDAGYNVALGSSMFVSFGASYTPGEAKLGKADDAANASDIDIKADQFYTYYIQPSVMVSDNTAVFVKFGQSEADLKITGDFTGTSTTSLEGETVSFGSKTVFGSGMYIQSEAGITEYDNISVTNVGSTNENGLNGSAKADPSLAFGSLTLGYKF
tara:strand:+ start:308 stop:976 length:669 start_codon:yes stop_codon:yes gene_type:complete